MSTTAMIIAVEFEVRKESTTTAEWIRTWGVRATDAFDHEPKTTAYEVAIAIDDSNKVLVFERYEGGDASLHQHMHRPAHETLVEKMQSERMTKRRPWIAMGYEVDDFGWRFSEEGKTGIKGEGIVIDITALRCSDQSALIDRACRPQADFTLSNDTGLLLYGMSKVSTGDQKDFDLQAGDLILSRVYTDLLAHESDISSEMSADTYETIKQVGGQLIFSRAYVSAGAGFVWKGETRFD